MGRIVLLMLVLCWPGWLWAQDAEAPPAVLVADTILVTAERELVASGNVEVFQGDRRLKASEIRYAQASGQLIVAGPITLQEGADILILASAAELDDELRSGLLSGARLVLNQHLQLAAAQIDRVDGRFNRLQNAAVTSCKVCSDGRAPLWQIRARQVIHDQEERQIYFEDAQFLIRDVPVFYLPRLRLPDPTLDRATGFLIPSIRQDSQLGTGLKIPYFIRMGDHRDLTLTPYLSGSTRTLEWRYRQAYVPGRIEFEGAVSRDDIRPDDTRAYVFGAGTFELRRDFQLTFDIEATTDEAYLLDYGYSDKDRLDSELRLSRTRRDEYLQFSLINFESLRDGEDNALIPTIVLDAIYEGRFFPTATGGELRLNVNAHGHYRTSDLDVLGRDVNRLNAQADWLRHWILTGGVRVDTTVGAAFDLFNVSQDSRFPTTQAQATPYAAVALRYPLVRRTAQGITHYVEPMAQIGWTGANQIDVPNEESTRQEFDEGNLLSLSRFPEADRRERGLVSAYGVLWSRINPEGWDASLTLGQVLRREANPSFTRTSGLSGTSSDFLVAGQIKTSDRLNVVARTVFQDGFDFSKAEIRGNWFTPRTRLSGSYLWLIRDPKELRDENISEIALDGSFRVDKHWTASADIRYDLATNETSRAGLGLTYENECVSVDISVKRRNTSSLTVEPSTSLGVSIGLRGFSVPRGSESYNRACGNEAQ